MSSIGISGASNPPLRALCVDDNFFVRDTLVFCLKRAGFQVEGASDGTQALALILAAEKPFDLLVTDYEMPGLNGLELCSKLRRQGSRLRIVIVSGLLPDENAQMLRAIDVDSILYKPFMPSAFMNVVKGLFPDIHVKTTTSALPATENAT